MFIRIILLYFEYLFLKCKYWNKVHFNGFTICHSFPNSEIVFEHKNGEGITIINSSTLSNMVGLYQRTIIVSRYGGKISIGSGCGISGTTIYAMNSIKIGNNVLIGGNCKIIDNDFHPLPASQRINQRVEDIKTRPIEIGEGCFVGANSIILKGVKLGKNCVVGAGSVVSGTFPDNVVIAGNPARIIKDNK